MKKTVLLLNLSLIFVCLSIIAVNAQFVSPVPVNTGAVRICDRSQGSRSVDIAMDAAKNKYLVCTENFNGWEGLEIALRVAKINPAGTQILYSKLVPLPTSVADTDIAAASDGTAYVAYNNAIMRISPDGATVEPVWSSLGLSETRSLIVDAQNNLFVSGQSNNDAAVLKVLPDGSTAFAQVFGGGGFEIVNSITLGPDQTIWATGRTDSPDFPVLNAFQSVSGGGADAFLVRLDGANGALLSSTYLGGSGSDEGRAVTIGSSGNLVVGGETDSADFPTVNALQTVIGGQRDGFVSKFSAAGQSLMYSTFLGGSLEDSVGGVALDSFENVNLTGITHSPNFPLFRSQKNVLEGNWQSFLSKLNSNGASYIFSTYQSAGQYNNYTGFDVIDDGLGGLFVSVNVNKAMSGGSSDGMLLGFSPYQTLLMFDASKAFKPNPAIRIQVQDLSGVNRSAAVLQISAVQVSPRGDISTVSKTVVGNFAYNSKLKFGNLVSGGYEYTLDRTGLSAGDYDLVLKVGNESALRTVPFSLK